MMPLEEMVQRSLMNLMLDPTPISYESTLKPSKIGAKAVTLALFSVTKKEFSMPKKPKTFAAKLDQNPQGKALLRDIADDAKMQKILLGLDRLCDLIKLAVRMRDAQRTARKMGNYSVIAASANLEKEFDTQAAQTIIELDSAQNYEIAPRIDVAMERMK